MFAIETGVPFDNLRQNNNENLYNCIVIDIYYKRWIINKFVWDYPDLYENHLGLGNVKSVLFMIYLYRTSFEEFITYNFNQEFIYFKINSKNTFIITFNMVIINKSVKFIFVTKKITKMIIVTKFTNFFNS
jgi:hypothetical protein